MCKHYTILYLRDSSASMFRAIATQTGHRLLSLHKKMKIIAKKNCMDCHYHDDMYVCWTLYRHNVVFLESYSTLTFFICSHLCGKTVYIFFIVKTRNLLTSEYYLKFMKLCYWISNESNNRPLKYENNKHFYAYEKWYEFHHYSLWIFFSPNLLRFVSMRAWHGLFFLYSFSSLCNSPAWKVKCKHEIIRKVHSWCIRKSIVQFFSLFFRLHCCNQLFNEYNNEHSYHLWMKHTHSRLHEIDNKIENID